MTKRTPPSISIIVTCVIDFIIPFYNIENKKTRISEFRVALNIFDRIHIERGVQLLFFFHEENTLTLTDIIFFLSDENKKESECWNAAHISNIYRRKT